MYKKIKVSQNNEDKMLNVLMSTNQQFKAVSINEYFITDKQCELLDRKKIAYHKINNNR